MKIKLVIHFMPHEISHMLLVVDKLKQAAYHIDDELYIDTALNTSDSIIDWDNSSLPKEYFIEEYKTISKLLDDKFTHRSKIFEGEGVYGHLDLQRDSYQEDIDYYIIACPDTMFSEHILFGLIESAKQIHNKYFIVTPEISKAWDSSWDVLVNKNFKDVPYEDCLDEDSHSIMDKIDQLNLSPVLEQTLGFKYAGWFDLYSKELFEDVFRVPDDWSGYGPWDTYSTNIAVFLNKNGFDIQQYILRNEVICAYDMGCLKNEEEFTTDGQLKTTIKKFLTYKTDSNKQRVDFEGNMQLYLNNWVEYAKLNKII